MFSLSLLFLVDLWIGWVVMKFEKLWGRVFGYVTRGGVFGDHDETPLYFCMN